MPKEQQPSGEPQRDAWIETPDGGIVCGHYFEWLRVRHPEELKQESGLDRSLLLICDFFEEEYSKFRDSLSQAGRAEAERRWKAYAKYTEAGYVRALLRQSIDDFRVDL